jgi:hypothetical protein
MQLPPNPGPALQRGHQGQIQGGDDADSFVPVFQQRFIHLLAFWIIRGDAAEQRQRTGRFATQHLEGFDYPFRTFAAIETGDLHDHGQVGWDVLVGHAENSERFDFGADAVNRLCANEALVILNLMRA